MPRGGERAVRAVRGDDAGAFLAAMLQGEEAVVGEQRGVRVSEDGEDAALVSRLEGIFHEVRVNFA